MSSLGRPALSAQLAFRDGRNFTLKVPPQAFDQTHGRSEACCLWIGVALRFSQADFWLEPQADHTAGTAAHLARHGVTRCDEVERVPEGFDGFWIADPADIVHLVAHSSEDPGV